MNRAAFALAVLVALSLTLGACLFIPENGTSIPEANWRLNLANLLLLIVDVGAIVFLGWQARRLYFSLLGELTTVQDAAKRVNVLLTQTEALMEANKVAWSRYEAADADAQNQRVRFLETEARKRSIGATDADDGSQGV